MARADTKFFSNLGKSEWPDSYVNRLPDSAFLLIEDGGTRDPSGRTTPRSLRHLPVYDIDGNLDVPHLRNAIAQIPKAGKWASAKLKRDLTTRATTLLDQAQKSVAGSADAPDWALAYLLHADLLGALGVPLEKAHARWAGDKAVGARCLAFARSRRPEAPQAAPAITKAVEGTLRVKVAAHNAGRSDRRATLGMLKAAWLRGAAAHDAAGRPVVRSRDQWGMARVHALLKLLRAGKPTELEYAADNDLLPADHPKSPRYKPVAKAPAEVVAAPASESADTAAPGDAVEPADDAEDAAEDAAESEDETEGDPRTFQGLPIVIDRPKGFVQRGVDATGAAWERTYTADYGYIPATLGGDDEELDVFLGDNEAATIAYWIAQKHDDGSFDEYKVMLGFDTQEAAVACYLAHVPARFMGHVFATDVGALRAMLGLDPANVAMAMMAPPVVTLSQDGKLYVALGRERVAPGVERPRMLGAEELDRYADMLEAIGEKLVPGAALVAVDGTGAREGAPTLYMHTDTPEGEALASAHSGATVFRLPEAPGVVFAATYELPAPAAEEDEASEELPPPSVPAAPTTGVTKALLTFFKADAEPAEERYVYGPVLIPGVGDFQGHIISAEEIKATAWKWMREYQNTSVQHTEDPRKEFAFRQDSPALANKKIAVVENELLKSPLEVGDRSFPVGTWMLGAIIVDDAVWAEVKSGARTGWSIGGEGMLVALDKPASSPSEGVAQKSTTG